MSRSAWTFVFLAVSPSCATRIVSDQARAAAPKAASRELPNFYADLAVGAGNYEHDTSGDGGAVSGDTDGGYAALRFEAVTDSGIGGGLALEGTGSDDDLLADVGVPDVEGRTSDLFLYFVGDPARSDDFRLPLRVGPYLHRLEIEEDPTSTKIDWDGVGLRLEASPEWWFLRRDAFSLGLAGDLSLGAHVTSIDAEDGTGFSESFDGDGWTLGAGLGVIALFGRHVTTQLGYVYRMTNESESDPSNGFVVNEANQTFHGVVLGLGVRF